MAESKLTETLGRWFEPWDDRRFWFGWLGLLGIGLLAKVGVLVIPTSGLMPDALRMTDAFLVTLYIFLVPLHFTRFICTVVVLGFRGSLLVRIGLAFIFNASIETLHYLFAVSLAFPSDFSTEAMTKEILVILSAAIGLVCLTQFVSGHHLRVFEPSDTLPPIRRPVTITVLLEWMLVAGVMFGGMRLWFVEDPNYVLPESTLPMVIAILFELQMIGVVALVRLVGLVSQSRQRRIGRVIAILLVVLLVGIHLNRYTGWPIWPLNEGVRLMTVAMLSTVFYWFLSLVPILWMRANGWEITSDRSIK